MKLFSITIFLLLFALSALAAPRYKPIEFVKNNGQWEGHFIYKALTAGSNIYLEENAFTYVVGEHSNEYKIHGFRHKEIKQAPVLKYHAYKMVFEGASQATVTASKPQTHYYNYFIGNDPKRWQIELHPDLAVDYKELYKGIDLHVSSENNSLKYDFILHPGADDATIKLHFLGTDGLDIKDGKLLIKTSVGTVEEMKPYAYQYINGNKAEVPCRYKLRNDIITYSFPNGYDKAQALIIDPTVVFATFTGSTADNWGFTATYDNLGNFYAGGIVESIGYPTTLGAFQTTFAGGSTFSGGGFECDMAISKFNSTGSGLLFSTYLGGSDNEQPHSLIVDNNNNLIIAGRSYSVNFPVTAGAFDITNNGDADIVVTKLNANGTALIGSTFIGGSDEDGINGSASFAITTLLKHNYGDDARSEVLVDKAGNIYVAGSTRSLNFPMVNASQSTIGGTQDAVVFKLNSNLTTMLWSTYLGGNNDDAGYVLTLDTGQAHLYVGGGTLSTNFPSVGNGLHTTYQGGDADGFIVKYLNSGTYPIQRTTFIGTTDYDQCFGLQTDFENNVYTMGQTLGGTFPVTAGTYSNPNSSQFIMKLDSNLTTNLLSTVYGSGDPFNTNISPVAFLVDSCENIYISGWGGELANFGSTTLGLPTTPNAVSITTDGNDFYFIVLSRNAQSLLYGSFMGGTTAEEHVDGGTSRFDKSGVIYQAICGGCGGFSDFPVTAGAWSSTNNSANCNLVAVKIAFQLGKVSALSGASPSTQGCAPFNVQFQNSSSNATSYIWVFGDGSPNSTQPAPSHTYTLPGVYTAQLIALNPNACNAQDTSLITITVNNDTVTANFTAQAIDSCGPFRVAFTNTSVSNPSSSAYNWSFGDGNTFTGANPGTHDYIDSGTYQVTLILIDNNACSPDTLTKTIHIGNGNRLNADFVAQVTDSCGPFNVLFTNTSPSNAATSQFTWSFGDGNTFTGFNPGTHNYADSGTYRVTLLLVNSSACSPDTLIKTVHIGSSLVKAGFDLPQLACSQTKLTVTSSSINAQSITWNFGDGQTSNAATTTHTYANPGTYTITLIAANVRACNKVDSLSKAINVALQPKADFVYAPIVPVTNEPVQFTNQSINATSYLWEFGDGGHSIEVNPNYLYNYTGKFNTCLIARNAEGCADTTCQSIYSDILPLADLPNAFSPNGDGSNDILFVRGISMAGMDLKIYNRWGVLVFESTDPKTGWDGKYNGKPQEMDAYAFILNVTFMDGTTFYKQGNVTLLR